MKKLLLSFIALTFILAGCGSNNAMKKIEDSLKEIDKEGFTEIREKAIKAKIAKSDTSDIETSTYIEDKNGLFFIYGSDDYIGMLFVEGKNLTFDKIDSDDYQPENYIVISYESDELTAYAITDEDNMCSYDSEDKKFGDECDSKKVDELLANSYKNLDKFANPNTSFVIALLNILLIIIGLVFALSLRKLSKIAAIITSSVMFIISLLILVLAKYTMLFNILVILTLVLSIVLSIVIIAITKTKKPEEFQGYSEVPQPQNIEPTVQPEVTQPVEEAAQPVEPTEVKEEE